MAVLKKYNLAGQEVGQVPVDQNLLEKGVNRQMVKDYLVALRANARQWSAHTKTRAEVCHSGQKPHPQKGTGRARQGYLGAPQYKGGGRVHAPRPKFDQHVRINKRERRAAIRHLLVEKILGGKMHVLQYEALEAPKTKAVSAFLQTAQLQKKRVLFLCESGALVSPYQTLVKSMQNIQKLEFMHFANASGYDIALSHEIVLLEPVLDQLFSLLQGEVC